MFGRFELHATPAKIKEYFNLTGEIGFSPCWNIAPATADNKKWDSELIGAEAKWQMMIGNQTFDSYFCVYHPGMKGKVKVL